MGATKAWSTRILEPTDHISRVGQDSEVAKSTRSVVVANPEREEDSSSFAALADLAGPLRQKMIS